MGKNVKRFARNPRMEHDEEKKNRQGFNMAKLIPETIRINRKNVPVSFLLKRLGDGQFWLSGPASARWDIMEILRRIKYGRAAVGRINRVLKVVKLKKSFMRFVALCLTLVCFVICPAARADHFAIDLTVQAGKESKTAQAETAALGSKAKKRAVLHATVGDPIVVKCTMTDQDAKAAAKNALW